MQIRKIKALEKIADNLEKLNLQTIGNRNLQFTQTVIEEPYFPKKSKIKSNLEKSEDFIPDIDISGIDKANVHVEIKSDTKNIEKIKEKLKNMF